MEQRAQLTLDREAIWDHKSSRAVQIQASDLDATSVPSTIRRKRHKEKAAFSFPSISSHDTTNLKPQQLPLAILDKIPNERKVRILFIYWLIQKFTQTVLKTNKHEFDIFVRQILLTPDDDAFNFLDEAGKALAGGGGAKKERLR